MDTSLGYTGQNELNDLVYFKQMSYVNESRDGNPDSPGYPSNDMLTTPSQEYDQYMSPYAFANEMFGSRSDSSESTPEVPQFNSGISYPNMNYNMYSPPLFTYPSYSEVMPYRVPGMFPPISPYTKPMSSPNQGSKRYCCGVCGKGFSRPSSLTTHSYSHTGEKPFHCTVEGCGRQFSVVSNLRRHAKVHQS